MIITLLPHGAKIQPVAGQLPETAVFSMSRALLLFSAAHEDMGTDCDFMRHLCVSRPIPLISYNLRLSGCARAVMMGTCW